MTANNKPSLTDAALLGFLSSLGPLAVNAYVPAFHEIANEMGVSLIAVQMSLTIYLATFAVASLFVGTISDRYGRKPVLMGGMLLFMLASFGVTFSTSITELCFWRFLQGLTAAVGQVVTQAVVRDKWSGIAATKMNGTIAMFFLLSPALAPVIGGEILVHFGWRHIFTFLIVYAALITLACALLLKESLPKEMRSNVGIAGSVATYGRLVTHGAFMCGAISSGTIFMGGILFSAGAADYVINIMKLGVDEFGCLTFPLIGFGLIGAWLSGRLAARFGQERLMRVTLLATIVMGVANTLCDLTFAPAFPLILVGPCLYQTAMSVCRPSMMSLNLDYFPKNRGMAASLQQFFITAGFAVSTSVWVPLALGSAAAYSAVMTFSAVLTLVLWLTSMHLRKKLGMPVD